MLKKLLLALVLFGAVTAGLLCTPDTAEARWFRRGYGGYGGYGGYYGPRASFYYGPGYGSYYGGGYYRPYYSGYYGGYYGGYYPPPVYYGSSYYYRW